MDFHTLLRHPPRSGLHKTRPIAVVRFEAAFLPTRDAFVMQAREPDRSANSPGNRDGRNRQDCRGLDANPDHPKRGRRLHRTCQTISQMP